MEVSPGGDIISSAFIGDTLSSAWRMYLGLRMTACMQWKMAFYSLVHGANGNGNRNAVKKKWVSKVRRQNW